MMLMDDFTNHINFRNTEKAAKKNDAGLYVSLGYVELLEKQIQYLQEQIKALEKKED